MSELIPLGEALLRELDKLEDLNPGEVISVPELEGIMRREGINLPDNVTMPHFLNFLLKTGWVGTNNNGFDVIEQSFGISAKGQIRAASSVDYADVYSKAVNSLPMAPDSSIEIKSEGPVISSTRWTGLPSNFQLSGEIQTKLVSDLDRAEAALSGTAISQQERSQARAYIIAMRVLAEAPEPQADLIWEMLGRANQISGIASLFVSIIALFATVAN